MFQSFGRSIHLIGESYRTLRKDPELVLLTLASMAGVVLVAVVLGGLGFGTGAFDLEAGDVNGFGFVLIALGYLFGYGFIIYFQVALVTAVMHRMEGGDPDLRYAIRQANSRLGAIITWTIIAATVGLILRMLETAARQRGGFMGGILASLLGFAWGLMVFFVIPVIAAERIGGIEAIRRSSRVLKQRWGEAIIGQQGIGLIVLLATIVLAGIPVFIGVAAVDGGATVIGAPFLVIGMLIALFMTAGGAALDSTYRAVLYEYAQNGQTGGFSKEMLDSSFRPKSDLRGSSW